MKTKGTLVFVLFALCSAGPDCLAQLMASQYRTYENITGTQDANGNPQSVTVTMTLSGNTDWTCCVPAAMHNGTATVTFGGETASRSSGEVEPNFYMDLQPSVTLDASDSCFDSADGCVIENDDTLVDCSIIGDFYQQDGGMNNVGLGIAVSNYKYASTAGGICTYNLSCPNGNQNATCGATSTTMATPCPYDYLSLGFIYYKSGKTKSCSAFGPAVGSNVAIDCQ